MATATHSQTIRSQRIKAAETDAQNMLDLRGATHPDTVLAVKHLNELIAVAGMLGDGMYANVNAVRIVGGRLFSPTTVTPERAAQAMHAAAIANAR
jgi:hypothetical protein